MKIQFKPFKNRVIVRVALVMKEQPDGSKREEPSQEATVISSNNPELPSGKKVFFNYYGAVNIESLKTKKSLVLVVDEDEIFATE